MSNSIDRAFVEYYRLCEDGSLSTLVECVCASARAREGEEEGEMDPEIYRAYLSKKETIFEAENAILEAMSKEDEMQAEPEPVGSQNQSPPKNEGFASTLHQLGGGCCLLPAQRDFLVHNVHS